MYMYCPMKLLFYFIRFQMRVKYFLSEILVRLLLLVAFLITEFIYPHHMDILSGLTLGYNAESRRDAQLIPTRILFSAVITLPLIVFFVSNVLKGHPRIKIDEILAMSGALLLNGVLTNVLKLSVGRPRPDFISRCKPVSPVWDVAPVCSGMDSTFEDGYKSFPSGHSSWSFATLVFLSLYLAGRFKAVSQFKLRLPQLLLSLTPFLIGCVIGWSRIHDHMHHLGDVMGGAVIGCVISSLCYFHYFHSLLHSNSDKALSESQEVEM